jgi:sec-independent protein translocase protein TatC
MATTDDRLYELLEAETAHAEEPEEEDEGAQMSLIDHLAELRRRIFISLIAVVVASIVGFIFFHPILRFLLMPLPVAANDLRHSGTAQLVVTQIGEPFTISLKVALASGIAIAAPIWLYQVWGFLSPALTRRERRYALPFTLVGVGLFLAGVSVGFITLRFPINWLVGFDNGDFVHAITADSYFSFVTFFLLAFGITFELPLVLTFLSVIGVVSSQWLAKNRAYILVALWIVSCFITPGSDPYSPVILGIAFTVLFFISEIMIRIIKR